MNIIPVIIGPTASGKTKVAVRLAHKLQYEIVSADSRQVYRGMDIGTGKDLQEYSIAHKQIPYHLIDIVDAGNMYNIFEFSKDFSKVYSNAQLENKKLLICGGSGLYVESIIKKFNLPEVPEDITFREDCENKSFDELKQELISLKKTHNKSDFDSKNRLIRALEIAIFEHNNSIEFLNNSEKYSTKVFGIDVSREVRRQKIYERLKFRLNNGLIEETEILLKNGITHQTLQYYGLEYKYVSFYLLNKLSKETLLQELYTAICQFAKRQMTWFRGMERRGIEITWIQSKDNAEDIAEDIARKIE